MAQEKRSVEDLIFGLNETMVGKFNALNERIDKLESTLTDDALALSSEHEALIAGLRQQLKVPDNLSSEWIGGINYIILSMYVIIWSLAKEMDLDPQTLTQNFIEAAQKLIDEKNPSD